MEVYHRLRIFENQGVNTDIEFPYISSSLDIGLPNDGFEASLKYAIADSTYDKDTTKFHTEWSGLKASGVSQCLRLYLCGSTSAVNATTDKTPHLLVSNSKTGTAYNAGTKPYKVANTYYLSFCGLTPEYIDLTNSTILPTSLGYTHDVKVTDHMLMAGLCTVVYGPYVRSLRYMNTYEVSGKNINGPAINLYHVGMSHWIDVSKLVACDPSKFHVITSEDDKNALAFDSFPNEFIKIEPDSSSADTSVNEKESESSDDFWMDKRCNASVITPNGSIYFRPEVSTTRCPEGYRVYLSCIFDNSGNGLSKQANLDYYNLVSGTRWDWINVQIWEKNTYLTADCFVSYYRGGSVNIEFENVHYYTGTTEVEDEDVVLTKAKGTIFAVSNTGHRIDIYAVTNDDNTIICTTELASSMAYDNSWGEDNAYVKSFDPSGSRATGRQTYNGSPIDITLQYKMYASTEVPIRDRIKYQLYGKDIRDEFHFLTSIAAFGNVYHKQKYYDGDNDPYIRHIPAEMYTGLKWDNIEYSPMPEAAIPMPLYVSAAGMNVVGYCCDQGSGGGNFGYITDSGYSFARYSTIGDSTGATSDVHPVIIVNPTKQYVTVRRDGNNTLYIYTDGQKHSIDLNSDNYFTKEEVDEYMSKSEHELHINGVGGDIEIVSGDVQVYLNDSNGKYIIYQEYPRQLAAVSQRTCWECVSVSALSTGRCNWAASSSGNKTFNVLHGPDNKLIGYIKWGSDFSLTWGDSPVLYLHWHNYYNRSSDTTAEWNQPGSTGTTLVYSYTVGPDGTFSYTSEQKFLEKDKWYAIIVPGTDIIPRPLEITDENGEIREEHKDAFQSASSPRSCTKKGNAYIFNITVGEDNTVTWTYEGGAFDTYFSTKTDSAGKIIEVSVKNRSALIAAFGDACLYYPSSDVCVDCDVVLKSKKVYNAKNPICIPEFSGCTFVSTK